MDLLAAIVVPIATIASIETGLRSNFQTIAVVIVGQNFRWVSFGAGNTWSYVSL